MNRKMLNDAKKVEASDTKNSEVMQSKLQQDVITLKQQLQQNINKHREDELLMRKVAMLYDENSLIPVWSLFLSQKPPTTKSCKMPVCPGMYPPPQKI